MRVVLKEKVYSHREHSVDVEFPLYFEHSLNSDDGSRERTLLKINSDGTRVELTWRSDSLYDDVGYWKFNNKKIDIATGLWPYLNEPHRDSYYEGSTAEKFEAACTAAIGVLSEKDVVWRHI